MKRLRPPGPPAWLSFALITGISGLTAFAGDLDTIGVTLLRQVDPTLTGSGVSAAHPEPAVATGAFEVNPSIVGQPVNRFTWISSLGSATTYPNSVGSESWHANLVGANFYGTTGGAAPDVGGVYSYDADYFYTNIIDSVLAPSISARVVNQSFIFGPTDPDPNPSYDAYAVKHGTIFVSGVGNSGTAAPPGTSYNGIGVGLYGFSSAVGPTPDGRSKPDLVAPDMANFPMSANSYSIPYVSGAVVLLVQAATRGDGGGNTAAANDLRTIKALLLNGAVKPADWTNGTTRPLDGRYGAGIVNVFNSWHTLKGGRQRFIESTSNASGAAHPPGANPGNVPVLTGWDFNGITNRIVGPNDLEQVNHYYFQLPGSSPYTMTATLAWNKQRSGNNNLNLFLYDAVTSNLVAASTSGVDNVEHLFLSTLPPGRYDLQVHKDPLGQTSAGEAYALAFEFFSPRLTAQRSGPDMILSWPVAPTGFRLVSTAALGPGAIWNPVNAPLAITNGFNYVRVPAALGNQFFRLYGTWD